MGNLKAQHWFVVIAVLGGLAVQINGIKHWDEALSPQFVSGAILTVTGALSGLFMNKPRDAEAASDRRTDR